MVWRRCGRPLRKAAAAGRRTTCVLAACGVKQLPAALRALHSGGHACLPALAWRSLSSLADTLPSYNGTHSAARPRPRAVCMDGSKQEGAVKGAVNEFAEAHGLSILVTYK